MMGNIPQGNTPQVNEVRGRPVKFGKLPKDPSMKFVQLRNFLDAQSLPPANYADWTTKIASWPMMDNDNYGDCVMAMQGHAIQVFSEYGTGTEDIPSDAAILAAYLQQTGGADNGLNIATSLGLFVQNGLCGEELAAYAAVDYTQQNMVMLGVQLFGGIGLGINLPSNWQTAINAGEPWTDTRLPPNQMMGHAIWIVKTEVDGPTCVTWGQLQKMSWAWFQKYADEAYVLVSPEWANGAPVGVNMTALLADYTLITGQNPPLIIPTTPPGPVGPTPVVPPVVTPPLVATSVITFSGPVPAGTAEILRTGSGRVGVSISAAIPEGSYLLVSSTVPQGGKHMMKLDFTPHCHEAELLSFFGPDEANSIRKARAVGIPWTNIIALIVQYGPEFMSILAQIVAALQTPPVVVTPPPVPAPAMKTPC